MIQKVDFDRYVDDYNDLLHESTSFFSSDEQFFARYKVGLVSEAIAHPVSRILEYGCGIGRNIKFLQSAFPNAVVCGTDISDSSLSYAEQSNPGVEFFRESPDLDLGLFDLIFVAGVFHHIPAVQRRDVMAQIKMRLHREGTLAVFEHNPFNPVTRRIVDRCPYDADAVLLRPSEMTKLFLEVSLVQTMKAYCLFVPPSFSSLASLERLLQWLPLGGQYWVMARHPE